MAERAAGFTMAPNWLVRDQSIPARTKMVFVVLASHIGKNGTWWMTHQQISDECGVGVSVSSVQRSLRELRDMGLVTWETRLDGMGITANRYHLRVSLIEGVGHPDRGGRSQGQEGSVTLTEQKEDPKEDPKEEPLPTAVARDDVERLCQRLADHITANGGRRPTITAAWRKEARLLLDRDGIPEDEATRVLDWSQADPFWQGNILSMPTFRKRFDQLRIKARASSGLASRDRQGFQPEWEDGTALAGWEAVAGTRQ